MKVFYLTLDWLMKDLYSFQINAKITQQVIKSQERSVNVMCMVKLLNAITFLPS